MKHTPGPWEFSGEIDARYLVGIGNVRLVRRNGTGPRDDRYVALVSLDAMGDGYNIRTTPEERDSNARLIAAAPRLLAALIGLVEGKPHSSEAAIAAIKQAEGK